MLKIKYNVKIEQLEELGFRYYRDKESSYYNCFLKQIDTTTIFINEHRNISLNACKATFELEALFDLIQAGLVEKLGE